MSMEMEQYWPQHRVFFVATLALFPDKLNGHEVNQWFYQPYFIAKDPNFIELELEEYRKAGYIKYEKPAALYKISEINSQKATADLTEYLRKWRHNELLSLPASKPPDAAHQQALLLTALARAYANNPNKPRVTLQDVYGKPSGYTYTPPFWELVLACQLLDKKVVIEYMDYDRRVDGLYDDNPQPVVDFKVIDKKFEQAVTTALPPAPLAKAISGAKTAEPTYIATRSYDPDTGTLFFGGQEIQIVLQKSRRGKAVGETAQGSAMRKLFKDVNTLRNGVPLRTIVSVNPANFNAKKRKLAINHLAEINRKVKEATGVSNLITHDQVNYYIARPYLHNV